MCKYNHHHYWENLLAKQKKPWQSCFVPFEAASHAIFVNTTIVDYQRNTLDNDWSCHPDIKSLLGFIQYLHLPLVFYYTLNQDKEALFFPISSSNDFIEYIQESGSVHAQMMADAIAELSSFWELDNQTCLEKLQDFCLKFNSYWYQDNLILNINIFSNTYEIANYLIGLNEFPEVLEEDIGLTTNQLFSMCDNFYREQFIQKNFVKILNHKIGCVI